MLKKRIQRRISITSILQNRKKLEANPTKKYINKKIQKSWHSHNEIVIKYETSTHKSSRVPLNGVNLVSKAVLIWPVE